MNSWLAEWQNIQEPQKSMCDRIIQKANTKLNSFDNSYWRLLNATFQKIPLNSTGNKTERQMDLLNKKEELAITRSECVFFFK